MRRDRKHFKRQDLKVSDDLDKLESYATIDTKKTDVMLHTKGRKMVLLRSAF